MVSYKGNKQFLAVRYCRYCQKPMTWRKKWEKCWDEVQYCSERCRREARRHTHAGKTAEK